MKLILAGLLIGVAAGVLGALCGVGGGIFMVPMFVSFLDLTQKQAVATSLAVIILTSLAATVSNVRSGQALIQWPLFWAAAAGSTVASYVMADVMRSMTDETLTRVFAIVMVAAGVWMWFSAPQKGRNPTPPEAGASL